MASATYNFFLDTRRAKEEDKYPLKLTITFNRKYKRYGVGIDLSEDDWKKLNSAKQLRNEELKELKLKTSGILKKADDILKKIENFSFEVFEKRWNSKVKNEKDLIAAFDQYIDGLNKEDRVKTAASYNNAKVSLQSFKTSIEFSNVTPDFLRRYETYMLKNGKSITTIAIYIRSLRTIINNAIEEGMMNKEDYPFGKRKYQIPIGKNIKKALSIPEIEKIFNYNAIPGSMEDRAKDLWIFTYLCNGINVKDICRLKWKNVVDDKIVFSRAKTERTTRSNPKNISLIITSEVKDIIKKWGNKGHSPQDFIFPFLKQGMNALDEKLVVYNITKSINNYMKRIGKELGIKIPVTTYTARHSFSTVLKRSGASTEYISEALGHSDKKTTENYLDSFDDKVKRDYAGVLTSFKKK